MRCGQLVLQLPACIMPSTLDGRRLRRFLQAYGAALAEAEAGRRQLVALDCGAGVGRVTEQLLLQHFAEVDLVEPSGGLSCRVAPRHHAATTSIISLSVTPSLGTLGRGCLPGTYHSAHLWVIFGPPRPAAHLLEAAKQRLGGRAVKGVPNGHKAVHFYQASRARCSHLACLAVAHTCDEARNCVRATHKRNNHLAVRESVNFSARLTHSTAPMQAGIEAHHPEPGRYDCIWLQWAALYLTDGKLELHGWPETPADAIQPACAVWTPCR